MDIPVYNEDKPLPRVEVFFGSVSMTKSFTLICVAFFFLLMAGCAEPQSLPDEPIQPKITVQRQTIDYIGGSSCWFGTKTEGICADPVHPDIFYGMVQEGAVPADPGDALRIKFPIEPDEFSLKVTDADGEEEPVGQPDHYRYTLPTEPGYYRYVLEAVWEERNSASYYFGVEVKE